MSFLSKRTLPKVRATGLTLATLSSGSTVLALAAILSASPVEAQVVRHHAVSGPRGAHASTTVATRNGVYHGHTTVVDRGRPGWWHGHAGFGNYHGHRHGHYFAPGYGYYPIPHGYGRTTWVVGRTFPATMRRYVVVQPAVYGLAPAPAGYGWYYADTNIVLIALATGVIVQSVAGGW